MCSDESSAARRCAAASTQEVKVPAAHSDAFVLTVLELAAGSGCGAPLVCSELRKCAAGRRAGAQ
jgi:hypothetical protein